MHTSHQLWEGVRGSRTEPLVTQRRYVGMIDTDAARLIYYGAVFPWAGALFTAWLRGLGHPLNETLGRDIALPVVHAEANYSSPLGLDDEIELELWPGHIGEHSFSLVTIGYRLPERMEAVQVRVWHAYVEAVSPAQAAGAPALRRSKLPGWIRRGLS